MLTATVINRLRQAQNVVVFTGAGVSAESGIQTFRTGSDGLWEGVDPMTVATPSAFKSNPQRVWDFYVARAEVVRNANPNPAHVAIAKLAELVQTTLITQNVDGLHQRAGSKYVIELHGHLLKLKPFIDESAAFGGDFDPVICPICDGYANPDLLDPYADDLQGIELVAGDVPICPCCGSLLRPAVVWFQEPLDPTVLSEAIAAVDRCDALICVGSSLQVEPAASMPYLALERGAVVIEVNPTPTPLSAMASASLVGPAAEVLPQLLREVWKHDLYRD